MSRSRVSWIWCCQTEYLDLDLGLTFEKYDKKDFLSIIKIIVLLKIDKVESIMSMGYCRVNKKNIHNAVIVTEEQKSVYFNTTYAHSYEVNQFANTAT